MSLNKIFERAANFIMECFGFICISILGLAIFVGIPYGIYSWITYVPPETFELRTDDWECTTGYTRKIEVCNKGCRWHTTYVCTEYKRK